jgi:hypothetical protein
MRGSDRKGLVLLALGTAVGAALVRVFLLRRRGREAPALPVAHASQATGGPLRSSPRSPREAEGASSPQDTSPAPAPAWRTFGDGLRDEWAEWMERRNGGGVEVDPQRIGRRLAEVAPGIEVQVGILAPGIVEVVGTVPGAEISQALRTAAAAEPGVRTVVDRLWVAGDTA